jgi:hypothetical protein
MLTSFYHLSPSLNISLRALIQRLRLENERDGGSCKPCVYRRDNKTPTFLITALRRACSYSTVDLCSAVSHESMQPASFHAGVPWQHPHLRMPVVNFFFSKLVTSYSISVSVREVTLPSNLLAASLVGFRRCLDTSSTRQQTSCEVGGLLV